MKFIFFLSILILPSICFAQTKLNWKNVDSSFGPLPSSIHLFYTEDRIDSAAFRAFYLIADLKDKGLDFTTDTSYKRRLTPLQFYQKNNKPLVVVNGTFFSFATNENLNVVMKEGVMLADNLNVRKGYQKDTVNTYFIFRSAIGIDKKQEGRCCMDINRFIKRHSYSFSKSCKSKTQTHYKLFRAAIKNIHQVSNKIP